MADIENFDVQDIMDRVQDKYEANKNYVFIALAAVALIIGGTWWYQSNKAAKTEEANNLIWKQDQNFDTDNFQTAIDGSTNGDVGYAYIASEYSGTKAGDIAAYDMGVGYLNLGKYQEAINALEGVNFEDVILGAIAKGATGDAYFELGKVDKAISSYKAAVNHSENEFTVPVYLKKLAIAQEEAGDVKDAISSYQRIKDDYSASPEAQGVEKFIAKLQAK